ncbi:hypothetical protein GCM10017786_76090 [Amycolatopsis deserti]|uniref:HTH cro/C1-type domain-containing protein n=2 Tax=Amycolatopsis deserti TaxID=185696 RepID=A0ABQ3JL44_9PSEU|nr:hypothetical protein GCM10017786_76090 [Amycolatopsis deserti]
MSPRRLRTADYSQEARDNLGEAVTNAREAAGHKFRPSFARAAKISPRSLDAVENGEAGVGGVVLRAIARALPNWDEDTPRAILEGNPPPPTVAERPEPTYPPDLYERELKTETERQIMAVKGEREESKWKIIFALREQAYDKGGRPASPIRQSG